MKVFADLTKFGIVIFVVITGIAGYALSFPIEAAFDWHQLIRVVLGLYFLSSGSLALNQVQEYKLDAQMPRTAKRPIPSGKIKPLAAALLSVFFLFAGSVFLFQVSEMAGILGFITVLLYNGVYTYIWKPKWIFGAVPGAIPGALPVTIGYAANSENIFASDSVYLFLIMFLWQMPHFWALAIRFKDDYAKGVIPTLPVAIGVEKTLFHTALYTLAYIGIAITAPLFVHTSWAYFALNLPFAFKVAQEFYKFYKSKGTERFLGFFMWTNVSMLVFVFTPVIDKWIFLLMPKG